MTSVLFLFCLNIYFVKQNYSSLIKHYVIDQSMISISDMEKMFGGESKDNPYDSAMA